MVDGSYNCAHNYCVWGVYCGNVKNGNVFLATGSCAGSAATNAEGSPYADHFVKGNVLFCSDCRNSVVDGRKGVRKLNAHGSLCISWLCNIVVAYVI